MDKNEAIEIAEELVEISQIIDNAANRLDEIACHAGSDSWVNQVITGYVTPYLKGTIGKERTIMMSLQDVINYYEEMTDDDEDYDENYVEEGTRLLIDKEVKELVDEFKDDGIVAIGCGGDINGWFDGVNNILKDKNVTDNPQAIRRAYRFKYDDLTCLLFPFPEDVDDFNIGRLAIVRLDYPWMKWWSDFKVNQLRIEDLDDGEEGCCPKCGSKNYTAGPGFPAEYIEVCHDCGYTDYQFNESEVQ